MSNAFSRSPSQESQVSPIPAEASPLQILGYSGTFDASYYLKCNPELNSLGTAALRHYHQHGWREGRKPNAFFDPHWYLSQNRDVIGDPLLHYVMRGEREGRRPIAWFDPAWYARTYSVPEGMLALAHYLLNRHRPSLRPIPEFDPEFYLRSYPDVAKAGLDPLEHYMIQGFREARQPFDGFDPLYYRRKYLRQAPDSNPLLHYLENRGRPGIHPTSPQNETSVFAEVRRRTQPGPFFENPRPLPRSAIRQARILAYYLPQFHTIAENNEWWGEGFTEWTNLARGIPRFPDHYQPRTPRDLGHYTLNNPEILERQAKMARDAGIEGFIFYFYWFNRKRLLEQPLEILLANPQIDLPFCLMWANENWSRRWDGSDEDILIAQDYRTEDDEALVDCFARYLRDPRYIHVDGRPLLMVYRPGTVPDAPGTFARWRALFKNRHGLDPLFVMGQAFGDENPYVFGLDGAIEFPPHKVVSGCRLLNEEIQFFDSEFSGQIYDYGEIVDAALAQPAQPFPLIRTAAPSWDNDARRQGKGLVLQGSTPEIYERWLGGLIEHAQANPFFGEPVVCINAWNEWAEGAYLEPDQHFGSAYLNATARACCAGAGTVNAGARLLLIGHDAFPAGAQRLLLEMGRTLRRSFGADVQFVLLEGGALLNEYRAVAPTELLSSEAHATTERLNHFRRQGFHSAIVNSAASAAIADQLDEQKISFIFLIHELPNLLRARNLWTAMHRACKLARQVIVPARSVSQKLNLAATDNVQILPQGLYNSTPFRPQTRQLMRRQLGLGPADRVLIGAGHADLRKGFDLFLQLWRKMNSQTHYIWLGDIAPALKDSLHTELEQANASNTFHMPGQVDNVTDWLAAADTFVLTSREDPFPSVVLEALASGLPCVVFDETGGIPDLIRQLNASSECGRVVPFADVREMRDAAEELATESVMRSGRERQKTARALAKRFSFRDYSQELLSLAMPSVPRISVVVPSYNYARHMSSRLASIFAQTVPVYEVIVLDDASQDNSLEIARQTAQDWNREITCVENSTPSGSVFRQWQKALKLARGEWIWIAEADDMSEPGFLAQLLHGVKNDPAVVMAFTDSRAVDDGGATVFPSYQAYYSETVGPLLEHDSRFTGNAFLRGCLAERNLVLNVSSAIFRRSSLLNAVNNCQEELKNLRVAGDWRIYTELLLQKDAEVVYVARPLNIHRRHENSATHTLNHRNHVEEVAYMHRLLASRLALPETQIIRQGKYQNVLKRQFGLS